MTKNSNVLEGIECPKCGGQGPFRGNITAYGTAYISDDGWDDLRTEETAMKWVLRGVCLLTSVD